MQEHLFKHFCTSGQCNFLEDVSLAFVDKTDPSDRLKGKTTGEAELRLWHHLGWILNRVSSSFITNMLSISIFIGLVRFEDKDCWRYGGDFNFFPFAVAHMVIICCYFCNYFYHLFVFLLLFLSLLLLLLLVLLSFFLFMFVSIFFIKSFLFILLFFSSLMLLLLLLTLVLTQFTLLSLWFIYSYFYFCYYHHQGFFFSDQKHCYYH